VLGQLVSSPPFPLLGGTSPSANIAILPCRVTLPYHRVKMSSLSPLHLSAMLYLISSPLKLKSKLWIRTITTTHRPPSPCSPTPNLYCYKKVISTLVTLPTAQPHLYFTSFLARAPHHRSPTHCHRSLSLPSHNYYPSTQWHPRWRTSRSSFTFWTTYRYVNSRKKIFWNLATLHVVIN
jgi:hypothetical protein